MADIPRKPTPTPVQQEFARLAGDYDRRWAGYLTATLRETLRRLEVQPQGRVLDVGCGTGTLLEALVRLEPTVSVVGVDLTPEMLGVARSRLGSSIPLICADVERLPFAGATFDVLVSSSSFHYWQRPAAGLEETARVLRPGGRLVITDWCDDYLACRAYAFVLHLIDRSQGRPYGREECQRRLDEAGYDVKAIDLYKINWLWGLMTATAVLPARR